MAFARAASELMSYRSVPLAAWARRPAARCVAADDVDVDGHRDALVDRSGPERVVVGRQGVAPRRPVRDDHALRAARRGLAQCVDGGVDPDGRDLCQPDQPFRIGRAELLEQEVVVRLDAGEDEVLVVVTEEVAHGALRREQQLGVDAVEIHVRKARLPVVATGSRLLVGDPVPPELVERHPRCRDQADRVGLASDRGLPRVAALGVLDELRRLVLVLRGQPVGPDVRGLEDVAVGVDDSVLHHVVAPPSPFGVAARRRVAGPRVR